MIVTLSGSAGAGKDTIADYLVEHHAFAKLSFADSLKDAVSAVFNLDRDLLEGDTAGSRAWREQVNPYWDKVLDLEQDVTPRLLLELVGTEVFRKFCSDIWIHSLTSKINGYTSRGLPVVIKDCRFINELLAMQKLGALMLGTFRQHEPWERVFYATLKKNRIYPGVDWEDKEIRHIVLERVESAMRRINLKVHASRWQFLLWNRYDRVIDNTKSLEHMRRQVRIALEEHEIGR